MSLGFVLIGIVLPVKVFTNTIIVPRRVVVAIKRSVFRCGTVMGDLTCDMMGDGSLNVMGLMGAGDGWSVGANSLEILPCKEECK